MSNTTDGSGFLGSNNINGFGYGIGISIGILLLIITITLTSFFCTRIQIASLDRNIAVVVTLNHNHTVASGRNATVLDRIRSHRTTSGRNTTVPSAPTRRRDIPDLLEPQHSILDVGLDESTILSYPKMVYSEAKLSKSDWTATCCSICLSDYKANDMLRVLPDCEHLFHPKCIDPWLRLHPTCPVCRTSPFPTPLSTPLAEVVPLASRRD
ncbi:hypothetical protein Lal_00041746 [Lupinus albus]|nr:hypothetical protein Lal_00041746 [Lupinus albus]